MPYPISSLWRRTKAMLSEHTNLRDRREHFINFEPFPVKKDTVYLIGKNQVHSISSARLPLARVIVFSTSFFERIEEPHLRQLFLPFGNEGITISLKMVAPLKQLFGLILLEYQSASDPVLPLKYTTALLMHLHSFDCRTVQFLRLYLVFYIDARYDYSQDLPAIFLTAQSSLLCHCCCLKVRRHLFDRIS